MTNETQPFDQDLYAKILDVMVNPKPYESDEDQASRIVAIVAARQPAPVVGEVPSDLELGCLFWNAYHPVPHTTSVSPGTLDGIRAVREALAAQAVRVPDDLRLPEGWLVGDIGRVEFEDHAYYHAQIYGPRDLDEAEGEGPEPWDALRDAIANAREVWG